LGLEEERQQEVVFLVAHHLLMSHVSERRDMAEEGVIEDFVARITEEGRVADLDRALERLKRLVLLTYADLRGIGPGVWTRWKGALLLELYERAREHLHVKLACSAEGSARRARSPEQIARALATEFSTEEVLHHLAQLPERIAEHLRLIARLSDRPAVVQWRLCAERHCTELSVCAFDRRGLFAQLAGTLTAHGANILSADVYTRRDGIVIDTFWLTEIGTSQPIGPERWPRIERSLREAVCGRMDVAEAVWMWRLRAQRSRSQASSRASPPPVVRCEAEASAHCTVIEVKAGDVLGLAYAIAHALEALGVNIVFAKIATEKGLAFDVFYVTDATGGKLTPALMLDAERAVAEAVRALSRGSSVEATSCREV
jgi:[protein-PII] uridylyltransferase